MNKIYINTFQDGTEAREAYEYPLPWSFIDKWSLFGGFFALLKQ